MIYWVCINLQEIVKENFEVALKDSNKMCFNYSNLY